jgi:nucleoside-diphosphate-sugar epimerase
MAGRDTSGERYLVTGSEGCIGSWTIRRLLSEGAAVVACDVAASPVRIGRIIPADQLERLEYVRLDLTEPSAIDSLIARQGTTRIVHLAALQVPYVAADPLAGADVNILGTLRVLEAARRAGTVRGISYASSSAVFGSDGAWGRADTLYGAFKATNEETARFYARDYGTPSVGLRPCVVYGPNRDRGMSAAVTHALKAAVLGVQYTIPFRGPIDLQYADDVAAAFIGAALAENGGAPVFDLHGDLVDVAEIVGILSEAVPDSAGRVGVGSSSVPGRVDFDDAPLQSLLGALPKTSLVAGIAASLELFADQREPGVLTEATFAADAGVKA